MITNRAFPPCPSPLMRKRDSPPTGHLKAPLLPATCLLMGPSQRVPPPPHILSHTLIPRLLTAVTQEYLHPIEHLPCLLPHTFQVWLISLRNYIESSLTTWIGPPPSPQL
eukprot:Rmarinus@m.25836